MKPVTPGDGAVSVLPNLVLDVNETAAALRVSVPTIRRFIRRKELPVIRLGKRVVIKMADIDAFLEKKREKLTG